MSSTGDRLAVLSSASAGGAGIAARRLAQTVEQYGTLPVDFIDSAALGGVLPADVARQKSYSNKRLTDTHFTYEYPGFARGWLIEMLRGYRALNIHWAAYLLSLGELDALARSGIPMIFTLHDFHYLTGGCHYPAGCTGYLAGCHGCPQLDTTRIAPDRVARNHAIKREILARPNVHLTAPSQWLRDKAVTAGLVPAGRAHVLRNPYSPLQAVSAKEATSERLRILLIADKLDEGRKQMPLALDALALLIADRKAQGAPQKIEIDLVGQEDPVLLQRLRRDNVPFQTHGRITDHAKLTALFQQADVVLTCSDEDNWPNILVEAGAYGAMPVVGPGHGCAEFVEHYQFGQVARDYTAQSFADALAQGVAQTAGTQGSRAAARIRADHAPTQIARQFEALIDSICTDPRPEPEEIDPPQIATKGPSHVILPAL